MEICIADRLTDIPFAGIRRVVEKATALEKQGEKVIHFEIGRPDFDTPLPIKEAAKAALDKGYVHYTPNNGLPALRKAIGMRLKADKGVEYDAEQEVVVTAGGQEALYLSLMGILNPGDEVLIPDICFGPFSLVVHLAGGIAKPIPLLPEKNYAYDWEAAKNALTSRTRAIIVNSPHNPTGSVLTKAQIEQVGDFVREHHLVLVADEAYDKLVYTKDYMSPACLKSLKQHLIICGSLSKSYAMTGWRIGYIAAPKAVISAAVRLQQNIMLSLNTFAQYGAVEALTGTQQYTADMVLEFDRRRKLILERIEKIPGLKLDTLPQGAFYVFPRITLPKLDSAYLADYLLDEAKVAVVDGAAFGPGGKGHFRISYAVSYENCREGMERIAKVMEQFAAGKK